MYTCPMHPDIQQTHSGDCPKCGMALERKTVTAGTDQNENTERSDMTKRFWIGAVLAARVALDCDAPVEYVPANPNTMQHGGKEPIYFESAAVIIVLVLFGQVPEIWARAAARAEPRATFGQASGAG